MTDPLRQTGRTTRQLKNAPLSAIFLWCNSVLYYPQQLAWSLDRPDIKIVSPFWLERIFGYAPDTYVVVDHAFIDMADTRQRELLHIASCRFKVI